jgi:hypothetical protein
MSRTRGEFRLTYESASKAQKTSKERNAVKYILMMMQNSANIACDPIGTWPKNDIQAHIAFMMGLNKELRASGELVSAEGLAGPQDAKTVRAGKMASRSPTASSRNQRSSLQGIGSSTSKMQIAPTRLRRAHPPRLARMASR